MNVASLISRYRSEILDDTLEPYLWSNDDVIGELNDTVDELVESSLIIVDQDTDAVVEVALTANTTLFAIDDSIFHVRFGRVESTGYGVIKTTEDWLNANISDWRTITGSSPTHFAPSATQGYLSIYPKLDTGLTDKLLLTVNRMPLTKFTAADIAAATAITDVNEMHHSKLFNGMAKRAYLKPDSETYDKGKAEYHRGLFELDKKQIKRSLILLHKPDRTRTIRSGTGIGN